MKCKQTMFLQAKETSISTCSMYHTDVCAKHFISHSHYMCITWLYNLEVCRTVGELQTRKPPLHLKSAFLAFRSVKLLKINTARNFQPDLGDISRRVCGDQSRHFKPKYYVFLKSQRFLPFTVHGWLTLIHYLEKISIVDTLLSTTGTLWHSTEGISF